MKTFKEIREAYGPAAPKMKRSMGAGKGTQYRVKYDGGTNTVTAKSPDDAVKKSMKFFGVGIATKDRYMKNASAFEVREDTVNEGVMDDYKAMKAKGKSDAAAIEVMLSMPKYRNMSRDQLAKKIGDEKRKGIFKR